MKNMKQKIRYLLIALIIFTLGIGSYHFIKSIVTDIQGGETVIERTDTITVSKTDTIRLTHTMTRYRPTPTKTDTIWISETDSSVMKLSNVYEIDSTHSENGAKVDYKLFVRTSDNGIDTIGLDMEIDYPKTTITQTITKEITKKKHWGYGVQMGVGYGVINRKTDVYVGFGVSYNF